MPYDYDQRSRSRRDGNGGNLVLNTFLDADNSPSDKLVVTGEATGTTSLNINNVRGLGAQTTMNGILVVQTGSTTSTAFTLDNPRLRAGAFDYRLFQGVLGAPFHGLAHLGAEPGLAERHGRPPDRPAILSPTSQLQRRLQESHQSAFVGAALSSGGGIHPGAICDMSGNWCAIPLWQSMQVRSPLSR